MSINNKMFIADEEITHSKLNQISADAVNIIDDIHPQYHPLAIYRYLGIGIYMTGLDTVRTIKDNDSGMEYQVTGNATNAVILSFKKTARTPASARVKYKHIKTNAGSTFYHSWGVFKNGSTIDGLGATEIGTVEGVIDETISLASASVGDVITIRINISSGVGTFYEANVYEIELYLE